MSHLTVGVVGAGAMGAGIAQVAAAAGHHVMLFDQRSEAPALAVEGVRAGLSKRVADGKLSSEQLRGIVSRIATGGALADFADCDLVIEAVAGADTAMKLGVNYPAGPFEWLAACGLSHIVGLLEHLQALTCSERYRVSPWLMERNWNLNDRAAR